MKSSPPRHRTLRTLLPLVLIVVAALALAACGSDSKSSSATTTTQPSTSNSTKSATTAAVIDTAKNASIGTILVNADGKTVYTLTKDGAAVPCTGACLTVWPPVLLPSGTESATGGNGVSDISAVTVSSGKQVTSKGLPLYTFANDTAAGDAKGDGLSSFGGTWHVVTIQKTASGTSSTTSSSGY